MPRFHLSTLLLLCVFMSAVIGVVLKHDVWEREYTLPLGNQNPREEAIPHLIAADEEGKQIVVADNNFLYLFDLQSRTLRWKKGDDLQPGFMNRIRFYDKGAVIRADIRPIMSFPNAASIDFLAILSQDAGLVPLDGKDTILEWEKNAEFDCAAFHLNAFYDHDNYTRDHSECVRMIYDNPNPYRVTLIDNHGTIQISVEDAHCGLFFNHDHNLAVGQKNRILVYRRIRRYGWLGLLDLPLTWIAFISFAALSVIFARWLRGKVRAWRMRNG